MKSRPRAQWLELVKALDASGAGTVEFAAQCGLNPRTLGWWRSKFRREGATTRLRRAPRRLAAPVAGVRLARVTVTRTPEPASVAEARLTLEVGGVRVLVPPGFESTTLASVLRVLGVEVTR